jgi:hypothetical protein
MNKWVWFNRHGRIKFHHTDVEDRYSIWRISFRALIGKYKQNSISPVTTVSYVLCWSLGVCNIPNPLTFSWRFSSYCFKRGMNLTQRLDIWSNICFKSAFGCLTRFISMNCLTEIYGKYINGNLIPKKYTQS